MEPVLHPDWHASKNSWSRFSASGAIWLARKPAKTTAR
jgi:hypothetical protein